MADTTALFAVALAGVSCVASAASAVYFRSQASSARRQAEEAKHQSEHADRLALMHSNLEMYSRFRETRNQFLRFPNLQTEWRDTQPRFSEMFDACEGLDNFIAVREAMDTMQDVYFLRKDRIVTDNTGTSGQTHSSASTPKCRPSSKCSSSPPKRDCCTQSSSPSSVP